MGGSEIQLDVRSNEFCTGLAGAPW
jgi:hypothetical protein